MITAQVEDTTPAAEKTLIMVAQGNDYSAIVDSLGGQTIRPNGVDQPDGVLDPLRPAGRN